MLKNNLICKLVLSLLFLFETSICKDISGLGKLIEDIFIKNGYNQLVRPGDPKNGLTTVQTELKLLQIDLDEKFQELVSTVWLEMSWEDQRLRWDPKMYDNVTEITIPVEKLWVPDIVLQNGVGRNDYLNEFKYFNPWISHTGSITWVPEVRLHTRCEIKVSDFPFDTQCCEISFYSWAHTMKQMRIQQFGNKNVTNITHLSYNTEWIVYDTCASNRIIVTSEELHWWVSSYIIFIKRETSYHIYSLLMPCFVLSMLSILLFLLPPDSGEKVTLGVTILLAFFVNSLFVSNYTPEAASEIPVIGVYYVFNIGLVSVSVATSVCVLNFHFRGHKLSRIPRWMKKLLLIEDMYYDSYEPDTREQNHVGNRHSKKLIQVKISKTIPASSDYKCNYVNIENGKCKGNGYCLDEVKNNHTNKKNNDNEEILAYSSNSLFCSTNRNGSIVKRDILKGDKSVDKSLNLLIKPNSNEKNETKEAIRRNIEKILKVTKKSADIYERNYNRARTKQAISDEWKQVASRIDFILFIFATVVVLGTPAFLFGKYFIRELKNSSGQSCSCDYR